MRLPEQGKNDAERWLERYLTAHGYDYKYEPDLGASTRPDFLVRRGDVEVICEVKGFDQATALDRRVSGSVGRAFVISSDEEYGPMRGAVREAARNLKPLAGSGFPLVVVIANPMGFRVNLTLERLLEAMYGNPGLVGNFDPEPGQIDEFRFELGRDGRLRNDHPYISGVAILRERDLAVEYQEKWHSEWKKTHESTGDAVADAIAANEAWEASEASRKIPEGSAYYIELITTGHPDAAPVPDEVFDGPRDRRMNVERVPE